MPRKKEENVVNQVERLAALEFVKEHKDLFITGPSGTGKSYLATALGNKACQEGYKVLYAGTARLISLLKIAKAKGTILNELKRIERADLLILDDFGMQAGVALWASSSLRGTAQASLALLPLRSSVRLAGAGHHDGYHRGPASKTVHNDHFAGAGKKLARYNRREPTTSRAQSHACMNLCRGAKEENKVKTVADTILDRLVHHALRVELFGKSIRKRKSKNENVFL